MTISELCHHLGAKTRYGKETWGIAFGVLVAGGVADDESIAALGLSHWVQIGEALNPISYCEAVVMMVNTKGRLPRTKERYDA